MLPLWLADIVGLLADGLPAARLACRVRGLLSFSDPPTLSACLPTAYLPRGLPAASAARSFLSPSPVGPLLAPLLACLTLLAACEATEGPQTHASPATGARSPELIVAITGDEVTVRARGVRLREIVETIASRNGLALRLRGPLDERVDVDVNALPLNEALHQILREHSFVLERTARFTSVHAHTGTLWIIPKGSAQAATSPSMRVGRTSELDALDDDDAIAKLSIDALDADVNTRLNAVSALAEIHSGESAPILAAAALHDADPSVRAEAVYALSAVGDAGRSSESLRRALLDPSPQVRQAAVRAFEDIGGERSVQSLAIALKDEDASVRTAAVDALSEIGGLTAVRLLRTASTDENSVVREAAIEALDEAPAPSRKSS